MSRMNKIIEIHGPYLLALISACFADQSRPPFLSLSSTRPTEADGDMVVQPGIGWQDVNAELAKRGIKMFFPVSLFLLLSFELRVEN